MQNPLFKIKLNDKSINSSQNSMKDTNSNQKSNKECISKDMKIIKTDKTRDSFFKNKLNNKSNISDISNNSRKDIFSYSNQETDKECIKKYKKFKETDKILNSTFESEPKYKSNTIYKNIEEIVK